MKTSLSEIVRLKKHKNSETKVEFDWNSYWSEQGDHFLSAVSDHLFETVVANNGLAISDHAVAGNRTFSIITA
jgi:hypothetical protein